LISVNHTGFSPQAQILPYVDQGNLHNLIDFDQPLLLGTGPWTTLNPAFQGIPDRQLSLLLCPSDSGNPMSFDRDEWWAGTNYLVNVGSGVEMNYCETGAVIPDGLFWRGSSTRFRDVLDGTSNTILMAEGLFGAREMLPTSTLVNPQRQMKRVSGGGVCTRTAEDLAAAPAADYQGTRNGSWIRTTAFHITVNGFYTPNSREPDASHHGQVISSTRSDHAGGAHILLTDGSVRFVSENVNLMTWRALFTRAGGEPLGEF
jgi:hypothetical protein